MADTMNVKVGFVPSYRFRYTPWVEKMREESLEAFAQVDGLDILVPQPAPDGQMIDAQRGLTPHGTVATLDEAEAVAEYFRREKVDGLILCPLDFGDERSAVKVAELLDVPVLLYATKEPPGRDDLGMTRISDSYCGNLSMASGLTRRNIPFRYAGLFFPDEPAFVDEVRDFVRAVAIVKGMKGARIGQIGVRPAPFETVAYDETAMIRKFGQMVIPINLSDITDKARSYADDDPQVQARIGEFRDDYAEITVSDRYLLNASKLELAMAEFWQSSRLSAMTMQCWPSVQRLMGISVCTTYGRLTGKGMLTACEADVLGALSMLICHRAAMGETVPHFVDWTIRHREEPNQLLAWHCGNAPACLARNPGERALRSRKDMTGTADLPEDDVQAGLSQFQLEPGTVTFCRLVEYEGHWKMLITTGEIVPSEETLAGTWSWVEVEDHDRLYRTLVEEGFIHHASMIHGDYVRAMLQACQFLDIEPVVV
jgi:L-fucose isomerase-like protein